MKRCVKAGVAVTLSTALLTGCGETISGTGDIDYTMIGKALVKSTYGDCLDRTPYGAMAPSDIHAFVGKTASITEVLFEIWPLDTQPALGPIHFELTPYNLHDQIPTGVRPYPDASIVLRAADC